MNSFVNMPECADAPVIELGTDLHRVVSESCSALVADRDIYQRDARLTRIVRVAEADALAEHMSAGTPQIRGIETPTLKERLTAVATFKGWAKKKTADGEEMVLVRKLPPADVVHAVAARGEWPGIRVLTGVIETPSIRPDGTLIDVPGYDVSTGYVYLPHRQYPAVPANPTMEDARCALAALQEPWVDFPFTSEAARAVPLAAVLTLVARPAINGAVPGIFYDASTRGAGKSLGGRCATIIAHGREAALVTWPDDDPQELEKMLGAFALRGASVIFFDNVVGSFGGGPIDKVLTATDRVELRVLGKSAVPALQWRALIMATGNNAEIAGDTARRVLVCRLEPSCERPEDRDPSTFAIPDLERWCVENHPRLVVAALTLLRAYVVAGRPRQDVPSWGSFQAWTDLVAHAIRWAGGPNVLATRATVSSDEDERTAALRTLLAKWQKFAPEGMTARAVITALYPADRMSGRDVTPDGWDDLREAIETLAPPPKANARPNTNTLGYALRKAKGRVLGGLRLEHGGKDERAGVKSWIVMGQQP